MPRFLYIEEVNLLSSSALSQPLIQGQSRRYVYCGADPLLYYMIFYMESIGLSGNLMTVDLFVHYILFIDKNVLGDSQMTLIDASHEYSRII